MTAQKPRGRAPKCYRKATWFEECPICVWLGWCNPKRVVQASMVFETDSQPDYSDEERD